MIRGILSNVLRRRSLSSTVLNKSPSISRRFSSSPSLLNPEFEAVKEALQAIKDTRTRDTSQPVSTAAAKELLLAFTCKCCSSRSHRMVSRQAYNHGIVIIECPKCQNRHLIADNLGWFKDTPNAARRLDEMDEQVIGKIRTGLNVSPEEAEQLVELVKSSENAIT